MDNRRNYYRVLQVQPDAPLEVIRSSYHTLLHKLRQHPDLGGDHWNAAVINEAFDILKDEERRAEYDKEMFQHYTKKFCTEEKIKKQPVTTVFCPFCKKSLSRTDHSDNNCVCSSTPFQTENLDSKRDASKRSESRTKKLEKLQFITSTSKKIYEAQIVDLSPRGIRFLAEKALRINEVIKIDSSLFRAIAEISSSQKKVKDDKVFYSIGAYFLSISFTHQEGTFLSESI